MRFTAATLRKVCWCCFGKPKEQVLQVLQEELDQQRNAANLERRINPDLQEPLTSELSHRDASHRRQLEDLQDELLTQKDMTSFYLRRVEKLQVECQTQMAEASFYREQVEEFQTQ